MINFNISKICTRQFLLHIYKRSDDNKVKPQIRYYHCRNVNFLVFLKATSLYVYNNNNYPFLYRLAAMKISLYIANSGIDYGQTLSCRLSGKYTQISLVSVVYQKASQKQSLFRHSTLDIICGR